MLPNVSITNPNPGVPIKQPLSRDPRRLAIVWPEWWCACAAREIGATGESWCPVCLEMKLFRLQDERRRQSPLFA